MARNKFMTHNNANKTAAPGAVVISKAPEMDYTHDYVSLPANYGTAEYFSRKDVTAIHNIVRENLESLDNRTGFTDRLKGRKVIVKPNLVVLYHRIGLVHEEYPQTTDPRVLDAIVHFLKDYTHADNIVIAESAGRGCPTRASFKISGINRLARHHGIGLVCMEEMPAIRYILPKAKVMKEMIVPEIFKEVIDGEAFYISVPKMKTNLYTEVSLGLKNAMGTITYNLRQRNHTYDIQQKLVDMLHLFQPGLVVIDGIVGAEGNCPAPVFPVDSRFIVSGAGCVETDSEAARLMGFDPAEIKLLTLARENGFGDPGVTVIGKEEPVPFKKANPSILGGDIAEQWPNLRVLVGWELEGDSREDKIKRMEMACRGGCLSTIRFALDIIKYEGHDTAAALTIILGKGPVIDGKPTWFDGSGKAYGKDDIAAIEEPVLAVGTCTAHLADRAGIYIDGCMPVPNAPHAALHKLMKKRCSIKTPKNKYLVAYLIATFKMISARRRVIKKGRFLDCGFNTRNEIIEPRTLSEEEKEKDFIPWDFPPMTEQVKKQLLRAERKEALEALK
jgi:uncharacterized protein (DUF362 family)